MLTEWTTPFIESKAEFVVWLKGQEDPEYVDLLQKSLELVTARTEFEYGQEPDPTIIHSINDGDYQGTLLFVIGGTGYQPDSYWYTYVYYGSCSGCDALQAALVARPDYEELYLLALHMLQRAKKFEMED